MNGRRESGIASDRLLDVVVVGGGVAGLTLAYRLRHRRVIVLERERLYGGRASSVKMGRFEFNTAAQVITGNRGPTSRLAAELGIATTLIPKTRIPLYMKDEYITAGSEVEFLWRLPLTGVDKTSIASTVLWMRTRYGHLKNKPLSADSRQMRRLDRLSIADLVGKQNPALKELWDILSLSITSVPSEEASALIAVKAIPTLQRREEYHIKGGTGALTEELYRRSAESVLLGASVLDVTEGEGHVRVTYQRDGRTESLFASQCVMAVPAPVVLQVTQGLPDWKRAALARIDYRPLTTAAFLHKGKTSDVLGEGVWRIPVVGKKIMGIVNPTMVYPHDPDIDEDQGLIRVQTDDAVSERLRSLNDDQAITELYEELVTMFPVLRSRLIEGAVKHWMMGVSPWRPGRLTLLPSLRASTGRIHYIGDYIEEQGMSGSITTAGWASAAVEAELGGVR